MIYARFAPNFNWGNLPKNISSGHTQPPLSESAIMRKQTDVNIAQWQYPLCSYFLCETEQNEVGKLLS